MGLDPGTPILVVDDYRTMVRILRTLLGGLGLANVDDAPDGAAALALLRERRHALVISDWHMAPMTGLEFLTQVRTDPRLAGTRFIMMTAESRTETALSARRAGVDAFLVKPFDARVLRAKLETVLGAQAA